MIFIAHRGNTNGPNKEEENKPEYLLKAINNGFYIETDLWFINDELFLGHDKPQYKIEIQFLLEIKSRLFCHCKNIDALYYIIKYHPEIECFFHDMDECVLTSKNHIWNYPGSKLTKRSICVMPERYLEISNKITFGSNMKKYNDEINIFGVCSDYVTIIRNMFG